MKKDLAKFKVLGITLLVTMSSCVVGSLELNAETLRTYGFEFDISSSEKSAPITKVKKSKPSKSSKNSIHKIIESGRNHSLLKDFSNHDVPVILSVRQFCFRCTLTLEGVINAKQSYVSFYEGIHIQSRAGPLFV